LSVALVTEHRGAQELRGTGSDQTIPTAVYAASEDWGGNGDPLTDTLPNRITRAAGELAGLMRERTGAATRATDDTAVVPFAQQLDALRPPR
jgi:FMN reductase